MAWHEGQQAATIDGFVTYLQAADTEQAHGSGEMTVNVLTYHGAKGLEWPWLVLTDLDASPHSAVFGVNLEASTQIDMENPLAGHDIRYWPWPFGKLKSYSQLDEIIDRLPLIQLALDKAEYGVQRLLYVGLIRANHLSISVVSTATLFVQSIFAFTNYSCQMFYRSNNPILSMRETIQFTNSISD